MTQYDKLKVAELKDLVKDRGIASTGLKLKQHYIDALVADDGVKEVRDGEEAIEGKPGDEEAAAPDEDGEQSRAEEKAEDVEATGSAQVEEPPADDSEMVNKRKRRSPTPPVREDSNSKKLKVADEKEDVNMNLPEDAPVPLGAESEGDAAQKTIAPFASSDDVMEVDNVDEGAGATALTEDSNRSAPQWSLQVGEGDQAMADVDPDAPPSKHPPTRALYIRELVRPLQPNNLRQHLLDIAKDTSSTSASANIEAFHLDKLRSHALVLFDSVSSASRVRSELHTKVWPDEPMRKPLWVDYIPEEKVQEWIETEVCRADMTRWEIVYTNDGSNTEDPVTAMLQEAESGGTKASAIAGPSRPTAGEGMPNAPVGPRRESMQARSQHRPSVEEPRQPESRPDPLNQYFRSTDAKPKIYYLPVPQDLADRRLDEFEKGTRRDWDDAYADPSNYAEGELRRYTFEDGDRLVDGGADFGLFGRRGRGGGFGGRGRGRGRGGDFYRGGRGGMRY
ncbi:SAP domain [Lecanosticta acicola]|uniref:SAP domain n=1 Tax=Lecanosticta acicola TaxID=111012 RepID=A0AAI9EBZ1_9PEZI|nr:SAP domain [Lecanosticta acicola]